MKLPGAEQWTPDAILRRVKFEKNIAYGAPFLQRETAKGDSLVNPDEVSRFRPSDSIFAFGRAAELAFATEQLDLGLEICHEMLAHEETAPKTPMQFAFYATVGALIRAFKVEIYPTGASLVGDHISATQIGMGHRATYWQMESSVHATKLIRLILPAVAASGLAEKAFDVLSRERSQNAIKSAVRAAVTASPEFRCIEELVNSKQSPGRTRLYLAELVAGYSLRLGLLRADQFYWETLRPKGSIVDWPILAFLVAAIRDGMSIAEQGRSQEAEFIAALATNIAQRTQR
jgi:hypothetical protein